MATALSFPLMTTEQFFALPDPVGDFVYELHFGVIVKVGRPNKNHYDLQEVIKEILSRLLERRHWKVGIEMPYGLTHGYDSRAADVAVCSQQRWAAVPGEKFLIGSPELVIQIKSPSNRDRQMERDALAHITHGATAVWIIKPERQEVVVITAEARRVYTGRDELDVLGQARIPVETIFTNA